ncbi:hypothetical protein TSAR_006205 [Trichomalopsis sarcophagae]|uniref:Uncharacterized protein n=1 Tax=Trichomalopsis sarcophagae TaxID=543379 RepID=A0A232FJP9_9HYME|nr:hypothetical protein TSAR_006205 [Trichomalopsis sarcophagae]
MAWNHEAYYLVVNTNSDNDCQIGHHHLNILLAYNVLIAVYTLYPYANVAPIFWKSVRTEYSSNTDSKLFKHIFDIEDQRRNGEIMSALALSINMQHSTCLGSIAVLIFIFKHSMYSAVLEFVRIFSSGSTTVYTQSISKRVIFISFVTIISYVSTFVQSRLSGINTVLDLNPKIESIKDLLKYNITTYGFDTLTDILRHYGLTTQFKGIDELSECSDLLLNGSHLIQAGLIKLFMESDKNYYIKSHNIAKETSIRLDDEALNVGFIILCGG